MCAVIGADELQKLCLELGRTLTAEELALVMGRLDTSGDGRVSFDEFLRWWNVGLGVEALLGQSVAALASSVRSDAQRVQAAAVEARSTAGPSRSSDDWAKRGHPYRRRTICLLFCAKSGSIWPSTQTKSVC